jgi:hypothetical protein
MKKINILFLVLILLSTSHSLFSKTILLKCDTFFFKIAEPLVGFKKAYIIKKGKWLKIKDFEVTDSNYILKNIYPNQSKCDNNKCRVDIKLEKSLKETSYLSYDSVVSNQFCNIDGGNKCYVRRIGKNLEKGYCSKVTAQEIEFDNIE